MVYNTSTDRFRGSIDFTKVGVIPPYVPSQRNRILEPKHVMVVAGDRGGLNAFLPVIPLLQSAGHIVSAYFVGTCKDQYMAQSLKLPAGVRARAGGFAKTIVRRELNNEPYDLLVVCASQSKEGIAGAQYAIEHAQAKQKRIVGIEDMYGSLGPTLQAKPGCFHRACVIDELARDLLSSRHRESRACFVVTGGPQFDPVFHKRERFNQLREILRTAMNVTDNDVVFLIAGGINGTAELLDIAREGAIAAGVADISKIVLRSHPRATAKDLELMNDWLTAYGQENFTDPGGSIAPTSDDVLPGVDFVLSGYSTTNRTGILYGMPGVVYVGTPAFQHDLKAEKGLEKPIEVSAGAGWYVQNGDTMAQVIKQCLASETSTQLRSIQAAQKKIIAYNDGKAALHVFETIQGQLAGE